MSYRSTSVIIVLKNLIFALQVQDNVCYDNLGHAIFLEDGGEKDTLIDGNLVAVTRKGGLIPADE